MCPNENYDFSLRPRKTNILTTVIRVAFRELKFESDPKEIGCAPEKYASHFTGQAFHGAGGDIGGKDSFRSGTNYPAAICSHMENVTADSMVQMESAATAKSASPFISLAIT